MRSDRPVAMLAVRLNDVAPDGATACVALGILNLTHRINHEHPEPLVLGATFEVSVLLNTIAHRFEVGHVIRLALSTSYWPMVWPTPEVVTLELDTAGSNLNLPVRPLDDNDASLPAFAPAEASLASSTHTPLDPPSFQRVIERDLVSNEVIYRLIDEGGDLGTAAVVRIDAIDLELGHTVERLFRIDEQDPLSACTELSERMLMRRGDWEVRVEARTRMSATREHFVLQAWLTAQEGGEDIFAREWEERIERDLV